MSSLIFIVLIAQIFPPFFVAFSQSSFVIAGAYGFAGILLSVWNIQIMSLRQSVIPDAVLGRATTSIRLVSWGAIPLRNSFGGFASQLYGTTTVFVLDGLIRVTMLLMGIPLFKEKVSTKAEKELSA